MDVESIPVELRDVDQWLCWSERDRDGKATKVPIDPQTETFASVTDAATWTDFATARSTFELSDSIAGVGFVFTDDDPFVGVDLDDCRDAETGRPERWAKDIVTTLDSFTEVSPSGTGYHVYVTGELPDGKNRSGGIELYETARFFTVTGDHVAGMPNTVHERTRALRTVYAEYVADTIVAQQDPQSATTGHDLSDEELLDRARNAKNGPKFTRLWRGDTSGYDSHSEADMALCCLLAFWTGGETARVERLFRDSGLYRSKWDAQHYADGSTYGEKTSERAVAEASDFYEPSADADDAGSSEPRHQTSGHEPASPQTTSDGSSVAVEDVAKRVTALDARLAGHELSTERVRSLAAEVERLRAENEHLHEQVVTATEERTKLQDRVQQLETMVEDQQRPFVTRLLSR